MILHFCSFNLESHFYCTFIISFLMLSSLRVKQQNKTKKKKCPTQLGRADALELLRAEGSWGAVSPQWGSPEVNAGHQPLQASL